jgi:hypothetical protein
MLRKSGEIVVVGSHGCTDVAPGHLTYALNNSTQVGHSDFDRDQIDEEGLLGKLLKATSRAGCRRSLQACTE